MSSSWTLSMFFYFFYFALMHNLPFASWMTILFFLLTFPNQLDHSLVFTLSPLLRSLICGLPLLLLQPYTVLWTCTFPGWPLYQHNPPSLPCPLLLMNFSKVGMASVLSFTTKINGVVGPFKAYYSSSHDCH